MCSCTPTRDSTKRLMFSKQINSLKFVGNLESYISRLLGVIIDIPCLCGTFLPYPRPWSTLLSYLSTLSMLVPSII
jgi:hypothetical protein